MKIDLARTAMAALIFTGAGAGVLFLMWVYAYI